MIDESAGTHFLKWEQQLRKGLLSYLALGELSRQRHYGYSLMAALRRTLQADMAEGTVYPLLSRLQRDGLISAQWEIQPSGPARKYYEITPEGRELFARMEAHWRHVDGRIKSQGHSS